MGLSEVDASPPLRVWLFTLIVLAVTGLLLLAAMMLVEDPWAYLA
jgi:hypothetical protein